MSIATETLLAMTIDEIMRRWPESVSHFLAHKLNCVGCPITPFETLAEVIAIYKLPPEFLEDLVKLLSA